MFVTPADEEQYNDSSNWTVHKLTQQSELLLQKLDNPVAEIYQSEHKSIKKQNKTVRVKFYNELKGIVDMVQDGSMIDSDKQVLDETQEKKIIHCFQ